MDKTTEQKIEEQLCYFFNVGKLSEVHKNFKKELKDQREAIEYGYQLSQETIAGLQTQLEETQEDCLKIGNQLHEKGKKLEELRRENEKAKMLLKKYFDNDDGDNETDKLHEETDKFLNPIEE